MRRRTFLAFLGATAWPLSLRAQHVDRKWRIGHVTVSGGSEARIKALEQHLSELGYVQDQNISVVHRVMPPGSMIREEAIANLVPQIDLLVTWSAAGALAAKKAASTIPTIFLAVSEPVIIGIVQSLAHPGGLMTGVTFEAAMETYARRLQVLKETIPNLSRVGVLRAANDRTVAPAMVALEHAAQQLAVTLLPVDFKSSDELDAAFTAMKQRQAEAVVIVTGSLVYANSKRIGELALAYRLPSSHGPREAVEAGGLVSIGPDLIAMTRQAAFYIDKIIKGASPAELPVEMPSRYEMHVNLKTARALSLAIPQSLLVSADELIE